MIAAATERRLLQIAVAAGSLVPLIMGLTSVLRGVAAIKGVDPYANADLDSHFRYLSGIFLVLGMAFASCVPAIERKGRLFRLLGAMVIVGGLARLLSLVEVGVPGRGHRFGLVMELCVTPLLMLWQARVAARLGQAKKTGRHPGGADPKF